MFVLSLNDLNSVTHATVGQDSADYNGPDGGQDPTQYGHGPETIEFRAASSSASFFSWAAYHPSAASNVANILGSTTDYEAAVQSLSYYFHTHDGDCWGFDPGDMGDIIVRGYHSTFGAMPTIDLYSVWFSGNLYAGTGDGHELGTRASDFALTDATTDDIVEFQNALDYAHSSPQAEALLKWAAANGVGIHIIHDGRDRFDPVNKIVYWDPLAGLDLQNGHIQSPALGLLHELGHAYGDQPRTPIEYYPPNDPNYPYTSVQEFNDITNIETPIAIQLGEPIRFSDNPHAQHSINVDYSIYHM